MRSYRLYIDGSWTDSNGDSVLTVLNPATEPNRPTRTGPLEPRIRLWDSDFALLPGLDLALTPGAGPAANLSLDTAESQ